MDCESIINRFNRFFLSTAKIDLFGINQQLIQNLVFMDLMKFSNTFALKHTNYAIHQLLTLFNRRLHYSLGFVSHQHPYRN